MLVIDNLSVSYKGILALRGVLRCSGRSDKPITRGENPRCSPAEMKSSFYINGD
ncbi:hypothetical protein [Bradyrhizobium sp. USDA 4516]